jgi:hypothetical protein
MTVGELIKMLEEHNPQDRVVIASVPDKCSYVNNPLPFTGTSFDWNPDARPGGEVVVLGCSEVTATPEELDIDWPQRPVED